MQNEKIDGEVEEEDWMSGPVAFEWMDYWQYSDWY